MLRNRSPLCSCMPSNVPLDAQMALFGGLLDAPGGRSPGAGRTYPVFNSLVRAIHRFASANSVITCAPFFASPR